MVWRNPVRTCIAILAFSAAAGAATADDRWHREAADPIIVMGTNDINPAAYEWISENGRTNLLDAATKYKAGTVASYVFVAAPQGNFWALRSFVKPTEIFSIPDMARVALQSCEFYGHVPCFIVSINGKDARDQNGSLPVQPVQLVDPPTDFDATKVPMLNNLDRNMVAGYGLERRPKAMFITVTGGWGWSTGDTLGAAVAAAVAQCQKNYPNVACLLYAVNNRVVFTASGPN